MATTMRQRLLKMGFNVSRKNSMGLYYVACSQCAAAVINGIPTHEHGCPNTPRHTDDDE